MVSNLASMAPIYQLTGHIDQAKNMHRQALNLQREIGDKRGQIWTLCDLAIIARDTGGLDEADRNLTDALTIAQQMGDPHEIYDIYFNLGDLHMLSDEPHKSSSLL